MDRLSKTEWLDHGLNDLATKGFTSLKADKLAKSLGVSRGSFYWHFKDLAAFHQAVINHWHDQMVGGINMLNEAPFAPEVKLQQVIEIGVTGDRNLEQAIRAWSFNAAHVNDVVAKVDALRLEFLEKAFGAMGISAETASARARVIYCGFLGQLMLREPLTVSQQQQITAELGRLIGSG